MILRQRFYPDDYSRWTSQHVWEALATFADDFRSEVDTTVQVPALALEILEKASPYAVLKGYLRFAQSTGAASNWQGMRDLSAERLRELGLAALTIESLESLTFSKFYAGLSEVEMVGGLSRRLAIKPTLEVISDARVLAYNAHAKHAAAWLRAASYDRDLAPHIRSYLGALDSQVLVFAFRRDGVNPDLICEAIVDRLEGAPNDIWMKGLAETMPHARSSTRIRDAAERFADQCPLLSHSLNVWAMREKATAAVQGLAMSPP